MRLMSVTFFARGSSAERRSLVTRDADCTFASNAVKGPVSGRVKLRAGPLRRLPQNVEECFITVSASRAQKFFRPSFWLVDKLFSCTRGSLALFTSHDPNETCASSEIPPRFHHSCFAAILAQALQQTPEHPLPIPFYESARLVDP